MHDMQTAGEEAAITGLCILRQNIRADKVSGPERVCEGRRYCEKGILRVAAMIEIEGKSVGGIV